MAYILTFAAVFVSLYTGAFFYVNFKEFHYSQY